MVIIESLRLMFRVLTFSATPDQLDGFNSRHLTLGLPMVWAVGYGRWWDEPSDISWMHRIGLGSVLYVFVLALLLAIVGAPLARREWTYGKVLVFVCFTALPAALYAIPVEKLMSDQQAVTANIAFLGSVSVYRVALLIWFFHRGAGMTVWRAVVGALTPLGVLSFGLVFFGMADRLIEIMGGLRGRSAGAQAYEAVTFMSCLTLYALPVLLIFYSAAIAKTANEKKQEFVKKHGLGEESAQPRQ